MKPSLKDLKAINGATQVCPVCGGPAKIQFTKGRGQPYYSCDDHRVSAVLLSIHDKPRTP